MDSTQARQLADLLGDEFISPAPPVPDAAGTTIAGYRVGERIGAGGMGVVYVAEQQRPRRRVALKLIRHECVSPADLQRFEHEAHVLARLQHPGIAQIHQAGTVDSELGPQPYFAMELVAGPDLVRYADDAGLDVRGRVRLLLDVCDAVEHAHQRGVVHRDLKPSNIVVDTSGDRPRPKILDFGVAKATEGDRRVSPNTRAGQIVGTLAYMSPEQASGDPDAVDTRTDIYALGAILYELLTGRLPIDVDGVPMPIAFRMLQEERPAPIGTVDRALRGDLEVIVQTALERDKERRYATASAFAADLRRYLDGAAITARPASAWYQLRTFARRNRGLVTGVAAAVLLLVGFATFSAYQAASADAARDEEAAQRATAETVIDLLRELLETPSPGAEGREVRLLTLVEVFERRAEERFAASPAVEAEVRDILGGTYLRLGAYARAEEQLQRALELLPPGDVVRPRVRLKLARAYAASRRTSEALAIVDELLAAPAGGAARPRLEARLLRGSLLLDRGDTTGGIDLLRRVAVDATQAGTDDVAIEALVLLSGGLERTGEVARAESVARRALAAARETDPVDPVLWAKVQLSLVAVLTRAGKYEEARVRALDARDVLRTALTDAHPDNETALAWLAEIDRGTGDLASAAARYREVIARRTARYDADHPLTLEAREGLAHVLDDLGRHDAALEEMLGVFAARVEASGPDHPATLAAQQFVGQLRLETGDVQRGVETLDATLAATLERTPADHPYVLALQRSLATGLSRLGRHGEAERLIREVIAGQTRRFGAAHLETLRSRSELGRFSLDLGYVAQAEDVLASLVTDAEGVLPPDAPQLLEWRASLGRALAALGRHDAAERELTAAFERLRTVVGPEHASTISAGRALAALHDAAGEPDRAAAVRAMLPPTGEEAG